MDSAGDCMLGFPFLNSRKEGCLLCVCSEHVLIF